MKPGYMINGKGMQLLASLGYFHFKEFIEFFGVLLNNCRNEHKKYKRHLKRNRKLIQKSKQYGNNVNHHKNPHDISKQSERRLFKKIDYNFAEHAKETNQKQDTLINSWISHKYRTKSYIFKLNKNLCQAKTREFNQKQKELWNDFKNDPKRITNLTLNYLSRRQSTRDIQNHRAAVL